MSSYHYLAIFYVLTDKVGDASKSHCPSSKGWCMCYYVEVYDWNNEGNAGLPFLNLIGRGKQSILVDQHECILKVQVIKLISRENRKFTGSKGSSFTDA